MGLIAAMWGVGTFLGPAAGGIFAQAHAWRLAFVSLLAASVASAATAKPATGLALAKDAALLGCFFWADSRTERGVFPPAAYDRRCSLPWLYAAIGALTAASSVEVFVPLFGQRLAHLPPLAAGFFGALFALGWTLGEFPSVAAVRERRVRALLLAGPLLMAASLAVVGAADLPSERAIFGFALVAAGFWVGIVWPHATALTMRAAAGISVAQLMAGTFGAAYAGLLVNLAGPGTALSARSLFYGAAPFGLIGFLGLLRALRRRT